MPRYDLIVAGAGLSGLSCAIHFLHRQPGASVLVLEKLPGERYSRYHRICGEALSDKARREMAPIELAGRRQRIRYAEERWPDGTAIRAKVSGHIVDRPLLLASMKENLLSLGGELIETPLLAIGGDEDGYLIRTAEDAHTCRWLVGADGAFSRVRSELFDEKPGSLIPVKQFLLPGSMERDDCIIFHFDQRYDGAYRWEFPCGDVINAGFPKGTQEPFSDALEESGRYIPIGALQNVVSGNCCLVGDAAAMVNPLSFGGIRIALLSGKRAAMAIAKGDLGGYQSWWERSPFSRRDIYEAYLECKTWSDEEMSAFVQPFRKGYSMIAFILAYLRWPGRRRMTSAYLHSFIYGW